MKKLHYLDYYILVPFLLLAATGVVMVYSASAYYVRVHLGLAENAYMIRQLLFVLIGLVLIAFFFYFKLSMLRSKGMQLLMWVAIFAGLLFLAVWGKLDPSAAINGASAWIPIGPLHIQPTEFAKLVVIIYLAYMFTQRQDQMRRPDFRVRELWPPLIFVGVCIALVFNQPDTGGAVILTGITVIMLFASGISLKYGVGFSMALAGLVGGLYYGLSKVTLSKTLLESYKVRRLVAALHPFQMAKTDGLQVVNSLLAIDHGGLFGVGLGMSSQKLGYLPEPYTDFILAIITEELGLVGATLILAGIFFLIMRFYLVGVRAKNNYHALIAYGLATMMLIQTVFNVGAVCGVLPVTGVTLPFISYGGSSMLVLSISVGIMLNISASEKKRLEGGRHA
ncbi:FtsW/RodA/SpoVE family cell cycle protein [Lacticaseibacillus daqingensis]|uniref:FtsW/RodA/SpoVE family cell cycle protein n=1 Tax=Lacticaseibacillus daqingensis TaxID=2486014 RepID=UPI000F78EC52|nr:FtsW/RodA/SpoVE family cell cycle protein [Lacticaseibacillus daqingensis]